MYNAQVARMSKFFATCLFVMFERLYFDNPTKLFSDLYLRSVSVVKFLNISARLFFPRRNR